jgi:L-lactate permease
MSLVLKALLSMAVAIAAVVAMATPAGAFGDVLGGIVGLVAIVVFARAIMALAAEPGEERHRSDRPL